MEEREFVLDQAKMAAAESDARNRLYYGLWIVFLGGFALTIHGAIITSYPVITWTLVVVFRALAIAGTGLNFLMQHFEIEGIRTERQAIYWHAFGNTKASGAFEAASQKHRINARLAAQWLWKIGAVFLVLGFVLSFLVRSNI